MFDTAKTKPSADETHNLGARLGEFVFRHRPLVMAIAFILTFIAASGIVHLKATTDYRMFFSEDNPELQALELLEDTYEKSDNVLLMIVPEDRDATSQQALAAVIWLTERAWQMPFASRVDSIANFPHTSANNDDLLVNDLVNPQTIHDAQARRQIREIALSDPRIAGNLIARDGGVSAVHTTIKVPDDADAVDIAQISEYAQTIATEAKERFPSIDVRPVGTVILNQAFNDATLESTQTVLPASLAIMAVLLGVITRGFSGMLGAGLVVILSVGASMGLAGWIGIPLSTSTSPTPIIVLTLAFASSLHVLIAIQLRLGAGDSRHQAIVRSLQRVFFPIFLASATTAFGFLTMNFSEVPPYRQLGNLVAIGTAASFFLSVTFLPALMSMLPIKAISPDKPGFGLNLIAELTIRYKRPLLWLSTALIAGLLSAVPRNELNDVLTNFFDEDVQLRKDTDFLDAHLSGNTMLEYSIASMGSGDIAEPQFLQDVSDFADWFRNQPETRHVLVISDTFRQLNKSMNADDPAAYRIPESRELASQFLLLYELSLPFGLDLNNRIDVEKSSTRMTVTAKTLSTKELLEFDARAKSWLTNNDLSFKEVSSSGAALMFAHLGERNIRAMAIGTMIVFLGISVVLIFAFRSPRYGLVSLASNFFPGLMSFGIWGLLVGEIGLVLSVVMAMTIGIVVDDTVHFLSEYMYARRDLKQSPQNAVRHTFKTVGRALFSTTAILVAGFAVLGTSNFLPTAQMGQLTAIVFFLAIVYDFIFLPPLLMLVDEKFSKISRRNLSENAIH